MIWLIFAHYMGDFGLQKEWIALNKHKYWYILLCHSILWAACVSIALEYTNHFQIYDAVHLIVGHFVCDKFSRNMTRKFPSRIFYIDQIFHLFQCLVAYWI